MTGDLFAPDEPAKGLVRLPARVETRGYTYTEEHRHRCEVRQILRWRAERGGDWTEAWLNGKTEFILGQRGVVLGSRKRGGLRQIRGDDAADVILADCRAQWRLGNRGDDGDWREDRAEAAA